MKRAGAELEKLARRFKSGAVKADDELKKTFAHVDNELAKGWHATAEQIMKTGKWSGTELKKGARSSVNAGKAIGERIKTGGEDVKNGSKISVTASKMSNGALSLSFDEQPSRPKS